MRWVHPVLCKEVCHFVSWSSDQLIRDLMTETQCPYSLMTIVSFHCGCFSPLAHWIAFDESPSIIKFPYLIGTHKVKALLMTSRSASFESLLPTGLEKTKDEVLATSLRTPPIPDGLGLPLAALSTLSLKVLARGGDQIVPILFLRGPHSYNPRRNYRSPTFCIP